MKRRTFLKDAALATVFVAGVPSLASAAIPSERKKQNEDDKEKISSRLKFRPDGKFKILQFTDTHYIAGDPRSSRAMECVKEALEAEKPDLVIHTGDILFGSPDKESALEIMRPISESGIPFAVALGNHDSQFGSSREEIFSLIRNLPGCLNKPPMEGIYGCSNDVITIENNKRPERVLYLFDSMDAVILKGEEEIHSYDYIRYNQIGWYRHLSEKFTRENGGKPIPSLAFFHIPLPEIKEGLLDPSSVLIGNNCEPPCPSRLNSGLLAQFRELGDVEAIITGHDHDCDYVLQYGHMYYIYGRFSGCDTVYNHLGVKGNSEMKISGSRLFEFTSGKKGFRTWIRLLGGEVQQDLYLEPDIQLDRPAIGNDSEDEQ